MTTEPSRQYVRAYLQASEETLREARLLLDGGLLKGAVNRAYYAMFYALQAGLRSGNIKMPKTHSGAINLFGRHFVKPGTVDKRFARDVQDAYNLRQRSDYEIQAHVGQDEVRQAVEKAGAFVAEMKGVLGAQ